MMHTQVYISMCPVAQTWSAACFVSCGLETETDSSLEKRNQMQICSSDCGVEENGIVILIQNGRGTLTGNGIDCSSSSSCGVCP